MNWATIFCKARIFLLFALVLTASIFALYSLRATARPTTQTTGTRAATYATDLHQLRLGVFDAKVETGQQT